MVYDISNPLNERTLAYPGDPRFELRRLRELGKNSDYTLSQLSMGAHCGTHIDAPSHFVAGGDTIDAVPAQRWISRALVCEVAGDKIDAGHIPDEKLIAGMSILFKTHNSSYLRDGAFPPDPCLLTPAAAGKIVSFGLNIAGIDWLTVETGNDGDYPVHQALLSSGVLILESILLDHVPGGIYTLHAAPLAIEGAEGSPARALLVT
jgi:arylformamidase